MGFFNIECWVANLREGYQHKPFGEWSMYLPPHVWWSCRISQTPHLGWYEWEKIITSAHTFVIQHILMRYQVCRIKSINCVLLLLTVRTTFWQGSLDVEFREYTRVELVGSLISVISGWIIGTAFLAYVEHLVDMTGFHIAGCGDGRCWGILPSFAWKGWHDPQYCTSIHLLHVSVPDRLSD